MPLLLVAFFCSGFSALLCQIVWQRMLGIFAGAETVSAALVVGAFLAGLGLGSLLGAKLADRLSRRDAVRGFALCEMGVAAFALLSKLFLYDLLAIRLAPAVETPVLVFTLCFAGLVLPTMLMGAALPLLARGITTSLAVAAPRISALYAVNTLGAGSGALVGGFLVVGALGFEAALLGAAALNVTAAGLGLLWHRRAPMDTVPPRRNAMERGGASGDGLLYWCVLAGLSGYVIVALEIVWVRLLGQVGQYHAYLFPTVLGVFLLADGVGMAVGARLVARGGDPRPGFFLAQAAGFLVALLLIAALWLLYPAITVLAVDNWRFTPGPLLTSTAVVVTLVAPPAFLIGLTFAYVQRGVQRDLGSVGARVGWVQLANIAGNAAGSLVTGLATLHWLGTVGTLVLLGVVTLGMLAVWLARPGPARRSGIAVAGALAGLLVLLPGNAAFWNRLHGPAPTSFTAFAEGRSGVAFYREQPADPAYDSGRFFIQGHSQGMVPFLPVHVLLGAIGPLLHPDPERVLVIGVGSAGTPWGALVSPATEHLRGVELIGPVLETLDAIAAARPSGPVAALLNDKRVVLEHGDGRRALARDPQRYDVIEADAVLPQTAQSGLLYSAEFLTQVRERLAPGGIYVQWAPTARVVETFVAVFPHVLLLAPVPILIGSADPIRFDHGALLAALDAEPTLAHARRGNPTIDRLSPLVAGLAHGWSRAPDAPEPDPPLTDLFPRDEFFLNQHYEVPESVVR